MRINPPAQIIKEDEHEVTVITESDRREEHHGYAVRKLGTDAVHLVRENNWTTDRYRHAVSTTWRRDGHPYRIVPVNPFEPPDLIK